MHALESLLLLSFHQVRGEIIHSTDLHLDVCFREGSTTAVFHQVPESKKNPADLTIIFKVGLAHNPQFSQQG